MHEPKQKRERKPITEIARRLRRDLTPAEERLWRIVRRRQCGGLRFLRQHDIGHFVLDFYCASANTALEIDGAIHDTPDAIARDREREALLQEAVGICFVRIPNNFILMSPETVIHKYLLRALSPLSHSDEGGG